MKHIACGRAGRLFLALLVWLTAPARADMAPEAAVPAALAAPAGQVRLLVVAATGVQVYRCQPGKDDPAHLQWTLVAPEADLFDESGHKVGRHYAGPTWELDDGSKIVGEVLARDKGPDAEAIPWLLLRVKESAAGGRLAKAASIQRIQTQGGKAPAGQCERTREPAELRVPYKAVYRFFG